MSAPPSPLAAVLVTVAVLSLALGSRRLAARSEARWRLAPFGRTAVAFGLAVGGFLVPCAIVARFVGAFDAGLAAAAAVGVAVWWTARRVGAGGTDASPEPVRAAASVRWAVWGAQLALLALYAYLSWRYQMHDEHALFGHKSMVEQLRRNEYPLYYPSLPGQEARYHYGFDLLAGALARAYGLSADVAIDLTGLLLVVFMGWAAAAVVADEGAEGSAPLGVWAVHLGAGLAFLLLAGVEGRHPRCLTQYHHPTCQVELFPTQLLNVFQHPVAVGVPMLLVFALLAPRLARTPTRWMGPEAVEPSGGLIVVSVLVLGGLAVGQFVYYALGGLAAIAALAVGRGASWSARGRGALTLVGVLVVSLAVAWLEGGMLASNPSIDPGLVGLRATPGFPKGEGPSGIVWHHLVNLGLGFVLLPVFIVAALGRRRPQVALLTAFALGGIAVAHLFFYARSWDIVKFPSAASFALSLLYVAVVDDRLRAWAAAPSGDGPAGFTGLRASSAIGLLAGWARRAGAVLLMGTGVTAAVYVTFPLAGSYRLYEVGRWQGDGLVRQAIRWWRREGYDSADVIFAQSNVAKELSVFGGLSVVAQDADLYYMGIAHRVLGAQRRHAARLKASLDRKSLEALDVGWLMFSDEETRNLGAAAQAVLRAPPPWLKVVATFEGPTPAHRRRIWRVER